MRILFAGTPDFAATALTALAARHEVVAVLTQPDRQAGRGKKVLPSAVKVTALEHGLHVLQPERLTPMAEQLRELNAQAMIVVAYGLLIPQVILDIPPLGCINIHASILPRWRGAAPIQRAIEAGDTQTGVSIMRMDAGLDTGPVFATLTTSIEASDTSASLHIKLAELGAIGIVDVLDALASNTANAPLAQDSSLATYAHKLTKTEALLAWHEPAAVLERRIRAFVPWPICQTYIHGQRIRIWRASNSTAVASSSLQSATSGQITAISPSAITVRCGHGTLHIHELQKDGGKVLNVAAFCNGFELRIGDRFTASPDALDPPQG